MRLLRKHLYVRPHNTLQKNFGIVLADLGTSSTAPISGDVLLAAEDCEEVKEGDIVLFERGTGLKAEYNGENVIHLDEEHTLAITGRWK